MKKFYKLTVIISVVISVLVSGSTFAIAATNKSNVANKSNQAKITAKAKPDNSVATAKKGVQSAGKNDTKAQTKKTSAKVTESSNKNNDTSKKSNSSEKLETSVKNDKKSDKSTKKATPSQTKKVESKVNESERKSNVNSSDNVNVQKTSADKNKLEIAIDDRDVADGFQSIQNNTQDTEDDCLYIKVLGILFVSLGTMGFLLSLYCLIKNRTVKERVASSQGQKKERYKGAHFK